MQQKRTINYRGGDIAVVWTALLKLNLSFACNQFKVKNPMCILVISTVFCATKLSHLSSGNKKRNGNAHLQSSLITHPRRLIGCQMLTKKLKTNVQDCRMLNIARMLVFKFFFIFVNTQFTFSLSSLLYFLYVYLSNVYICRFCQCEI